MTGTVATAFCWPETSFQPPKALTVIDQARAKTLRHKAGRNDKPLATLIIGVRLADYAPERLINLSTLLEWIDHYYSDLFEVLLVEQDAIPRIDLSSLKTKPYVRREFLFNPNEFNRGWGYNAAVSHFCKDAEVVAFLDTDVLTGAGFVDAIMSCFSDADVCSPYTEIYYTSEEEAERIRETKRISHLTDPAAIKNPVTICGGIVIFRRSVFLSLHGFEQYIGYGCEDRAMDVTVLNHIPPDRLKVVPEVYAHLHHPVDKVARKQGKQIHEHLGKHYGCAYHREIKPFEYIHRMCSHVAPDKTLNLLVDRARDFGALDLYLSRADLTINGQKQRENSLSTDEAYIFPPSFEGLSSYPSRETYPGAGSPDSAELATFYNRYKGERCFIIGNGPSLNKHDLSLLEGEFSFGVNSFYYKTRETGFVPTFYVVEDSSVMKENVAEIVAFDAPFKFFPTIYRKLHPKKPNTFFFEMNRSFYEKSSPYYVVPRFSADASKVVYCGQSVTYINLQLAFFMGFTEVHLIGMDFDYVIPTSHKRNGDVLLSDSDDPNHFHKDYFGAGKTWKDPKLERVALNYRQAKLSYEAVGRRIYNATIGGKLEIFDRVDYDLLLTDPNTRMKRTQRISAQEALIPTVEPEPAQILVPSSISSGVRGPHKVGDREQARHLLRSLCSDLLTQKVALTRIRDDHETSAQIGQSLMILSSDDEIAVHFNRVMEYAKRSTQASPTNTG